MSFVNNTVNVIGVVTAYFRTNEFEKNAIKNRRIGYYQAFTIILALSNKVAHPLPFLTPIISIVDSLIVQLPHKSNSISKITIILYTVFKKI